jgi:HK97 family phage major capsid protein
MKFKYPFLSATLVILALVLCLSAIGAINLTQAFGLLLIGQIAMLCLSRPRAALFVSGLSPDQLEEFSQMIGDIKDQWAPVKAMLKEFPDVRASLNKLRKNFAVGIGGSTGVSWVGNVPFVTPDCAEHLTAAFIMEVNNLKAMDTLVRDRSAQERVLAKAMGISGMQFRTAMGSTEIPVPTIYAAQIIELVYAYGQARQFATVFPLGAGTVKLPRLKAGEDDFGYLGAGTAGMSQPVPEKRVTAELVTFTANKAGGLIRIPYELEEDTFVPIGQFLARYIARQLAKLEDKTLFIADGTATYAGQTGIGTYCATPVAGATPYLLQLAAGKTKPSDATLDDFRNMRALVSPAILGNMAANGQTSAAYYMSPSFEPFLRSFNKYPNFIVFEYINGKPYFDGWPVRWIGVSQAYKTAAAASAFLAFFGDLSFWYLGERGAPRVEVSKEVFFATDELAMRALERIDVEVLGVDAMATLQTAAQ